MKLLALALAAVLWVGGAGAQDVPPSDPADYPDAPGREETVMFCGTCHSFRIVASQGLTRAQWDESLKWMVQRHNMPQLDREDLDAVLGYLEKVYPPKSTGGRPGWSNPFAPRQ